MNRRLASLGLLLGSAAVASAGYPVSVQPPAAPPVQQAQYPSPSMNQSLAGAVQSALTSQPPAAAAPQVMSSTPTNWGAAGPPHYPNAPCATATAAPAGCATGACDATAGKDRGSCFDRLKQWLCWHEQDTTHALPRFAPYQAPLRTYFTCTPPVGYGYYQATGRTVGYATHVPPCGAQGGCAAPAAGCAAAPSPAPAVASAAPAAPKLLRIPLSTTPQEEAYPPVATRPLAAQVAAFFTPKAPSYDDPTAVPAAGVSPTKPFTRP